MMKCFHIQISCFTCLTLLFCQCTPDKTENSDSTEGWNYNDPSQSCLRSEPSTELPKEFDVKISMYFSDEKFEDSTFSGTTWFKNDTAIYTEGKSVFKEPNSYYIDPGTIKEANGKKILETFDENICETGGRSAWNKYLIEYDNVKRPAKIEHYKAWWYEGLLDFWGQEPDKKPEKPEYFLNAIITYTYDSLHTIESTYFPKYEMTDIRTTSYDQHSRIVLETYQTSNYKEKFYFEYSE